MLTASRAQIRSLLRRGEVIEIGGRPRKPSGPRTLHLLLAFAAIYLIWGSTYLGIRYAVETIPPLLMMGTRHLAAGLMLYAWLRLRGTPAPLRMHWKGAAIAGGFFFLGSHGSLAWAEQRVPSGLAALLCATLPLWIVLMTRLRGEKRHLSAPVLGGLLLGFVGVAILIGPAALETGSRSSLLYAGVVLMGAFLWAIGTMYTQHATLPSSSSLSAAMQMIAGGVILWVAGLVTGERVHPAAITGKSVLSLAYLIIFGSLIAFTAFTWLHKVSSPTRNSTYAYVNPVVAVFVGWFFAGEEVGIRTIVATAIIVAGVALVNRGKEASPHERKPDIAALELAEQEMSAD
ncbi:MAG TPA: EamA family transporter [Terriglobales bacterium]|jgi:drug/metabolite transporter (DMT)-like permease